MKAAIITFACILQVALLNAQPSIEWIIPKTFCKGEIKVDVNKNDWNQWYELGHYPDTSAPVAWDHCANAYNIKGDSVWADLWDLGNTRDDARDVIFFDDSILIYGFSGDSLGNWYNVFTTYDYNGQIKNRTLTIDSFPFCGGASLFQGTSGNYYARGQALCKYASNYDVLNREEGAGDIVSVDSMENLYIIGGLNKDSLNLTGYWPISKYDSSFTLIWDYQYGPVGGLDFITDYTFDDQFNSYTTGWKFGPADQDYVTIKVDSTGAEQWVNIYNGAANYVDKPYAMVVDEIGNVFVTGEVQEIFCGAPWWCFDVATIKYDSNGAEQWVKHYNGPANDWDRGNAIAVDDSGYIYVGAASIGNDGDNDYVIIKYDTGGNELWVERYEELGGPVLNYLALDKNYNIYVAGSGPVIKYCQYGAVASFVADTLNAIIGDTITFTNSSFNATWLVWNFGDGETDTVNYNTSHTYDSSGTYTVELIAWNSCGADTSNITVQVDSDFVGIGEDQSTNTIITVHPNPARDKLNITVSNNSELYEVKIFNLLGQEVYAENFTLTTTINISGIYPKGLYFVDVRNDATGEGMVSKIVLIQF